MIKKAFKLIIPKKLYFHPQKTIIQMMPGQKILNDWNYDQKTFTELPLAITACYTTRMLANLMKENLDKLNDKFISLALAHIVKYDLELQEEFDDIIIPIVKEFLKNMNREHNKALGKIITHLGLLKVQNKELWQLVEDKLIKEKLIRYLYLDDLVGISQGLQQAGVINQQIFSKLEDLLVQQRLALTEEQRIATIQAFQGLHLGSKVLYKAMENPQIDLIEFMNSENKTKELN